MWRDDTVRAALALAYMNKKFLYEVNPNIMPYTYLSLEEILLWQKFLDHMEERRNKPTTSPRKRR